MKKIVIFFMSIIMIWGSGNITVYAEKKMSDITGTEWFANDVGLLVERGIINGFPDGTYRPDDTFKIDEFIKSLVMALHYRPAIVSSNYWAQGYIDTAKSLYWLQYVNSGKEIEDYSAPITREQMSIILYSAVRDIPGVQMNGNSVNLMYKVSEYQRGIFIDPKSSIEGMSTYDMLITIYGLGIITGYPDGTYGSKKYLTRAEAAAVLARIIDPSRRIYPDVGFTPPQKGIVEVEGITFNYNVDLIKRETENRVDYYMSTEMQEYFALKHFESFKVNRDGTVKFYMPKLPDGFLAHSAVVVHYFDGVKGEKINSKWFTETLYGTAGNIPPLDDGKWYEYKSEKDFEHIDYILIMYVISYTEYYGKDYMYNYSFFYEFPQDHYKIYDDYSWESILVTIPWKVDFCK